MAIARTDSTAPMDPTAIPAFAPVDKDESVLLPPLLTGCVAVAAAAVIAADVVAKAELLVATELAAAAEEDEDGAVEVVSTAVTAYPSTHEIVPPAEDGRLACRSSACSPTKSVDLLVQSQDPRRLRDV